MAIVAQQVAILAILALVGYVLVKTGKADAQHAKLLSALVVYVCFPCTVFRTFSNQFTVEYLAHNYQPLLLSVVLVTLVAIAAKKAAKLFSKDPYEQNVYGYSLIVPNAGYMGSALVEALYGQAVLLNQIMFNLPLTVFTYTEGYRMLVSGDKMSFKRLINPVTIAILLGAAVGISGWQMPALLSTVVDRANNCMAPLSMLLTGMAISEFHIPELLKNKKVYLLTFLRLIVIPFTLAGAVSLFASKQIVLSVIMLYAMPCGLNTIIFPKLIGRDCRTGASMALISNLLAILTIPLCVELFL